MSIIADCIYGITRVTDNVSIHIDEEAVTNLLQTWRMDNVSGCTRRVQDKNEEARRMISYRLGGTDKQMAERLGMKSRTFGNWRLVRGLQATARKRRDYRMEEDE